MDEISIFEEMFRTELLSVVELVECVGEGVFNSLAPPKAPLPYAVFTVVPLEDNTGQARTSIQTRLLVDFKIITPFPVPPTVAPAVAAVKEHFRTSRTFDAADSYRVSIRHERPLSFVETGSVPGEKLLNRGGTYRAWMSRADA